MSPRNIAKLRKLWKLYQDCQLVWARQHGPIEQVLHQLNMTTLELIEMQLEELNTGGIPWEKAVYMTDGELNERFILATGLPAG